MTHLTIQRSQASRDSEANANRADWVLTDIQFAIAACFGAGIITDTEAEEWVANGTLPAIVVTALASIENNMERAMARIRARGARTIARTDPLVEMLKMQMEMTDAEVDQLFLMGMEL